MKRLIPVVAAAWAVLALAAGCGDFAFGEKDQSGEHNAADVEFARGMVSHHEQAVAMAELAATRAQRPEVSGLARRILEGQRPQLGTLRAWLEDWTKTEVRPLGPPPSAGAEPEAATAGDHGGGVELPVGSGIDGATGMGLASEEELRHLEAASGADFDRAFVELMGEHHQGAIAVATREVGLGRNTDAKALAGAMRATQAAELDELRRLQAG